MKIICHNFFELTSWFFRRHGNQEIANMSLDVSPLMNRNQFIRISDVVIIKRKRKRIWRNRSEIVMS